MADSRRTPEELKNIEFNYFVAFRIELNLTDPTKIQDKIKTVYSSPAGDLKSRRLLELKDDVNEIMVNDSVFDPATGTYKKGAGGRKKELDAAKKMKLDGAVDFLVDLCKTRDTILMSEIDDLAKRDNPNTTNEAAKFYSKDDLVKALQDATKGTAVKIIDNMDNSIPFNDYKKIDEQLATAQKNTLYEFLGLPQNASEADLKKANKDKYSESSKWGGAKLKEKQLYSTLCGFCTKHLEDPAKRKSYDQYILLKDTVWEQFKQRQIRGLKNLTFDEYIGFVELVKKTLSVSTQEAEKIIAVGCKYFTLTIVGDAAKGGTEECPFCGRLVQKGAKSCQHCGKSLEVRCWNCGELKRIQANDVACKKCGATEKHKTLYDKKVAEMNTVISAPVVDINKAQSLLLDIKNIVPNYNAVKDSVIAKKLAEYQTQVDKAVKLEESMGQKYRDDYQKVRLAMNKKEFINALNMAKKLQTTYGTYRQNDTVALISEINTKIAEAKRYVDAAKATADINVVITNASKALEICVDYIEAKQLLQKYPPQPVTSLRVAVVGNKVSIDWVDPKAQKYVTFTVIKKNNIAPSGYDDGAVVGEGLTFTHIDDENILPATVYYYAVYVNRNGVKSQLVVCPTPVQIYPDVTGIEQIIVSKGIKVTYVPPKNLKEIEVYKNRGPVAPSRVGEGKKLVCSNDGFIDEEANEETSYFIVSKYLTNGKTLYSRGVKVTFRPYGEIKPLQNVKIHQESGRYILDCAPGYTGQISIYDSTKRNSIKAGVTYKYQDFTKMSDGFVKIPTSFNAEGKVTFGLTPNKVYQLYPIVFTDQLFVASSPILINTLKPIENLDYEVKGGSLYIKGIPNPKAKRIIIKINKEKHAGVEDPGDTYPHQPSELQGGRAIEVKLQSGTISYVSIYAESVDDGVSSFSSIQVIENPIDYREKVSVKYKMDYVVDRFKPFKVKLEFIADLPTKLPTLLLVKGNPTPLNAASGELVEKIEPIELKKGLFSKEYSAKVTVTLPPMSPSNKLALFTGDANAKVTLRKIAL